MADSDGTQRQKPQVGHGLPFPLSTGAAMSWGTDAAARQTAKDFGKLHMDGMAQLAKLGEPHGGGLHGILVGVIEAYLSAGLISDSDRTRLIDLFDAFRDRDEVKATKRINAIHEAALADPKATPAAIAVSSVAVSARDPAINSAWTNGFLTGYADAAGSLVGTGGGPGGVISTGIMASTLAEHTLVSYT